MSISLQIPNQGMFHFKTFFLHSYHYAAGSKGGADDNSLVFVSVFTSMERGQSSGWEQIGEGVGALLSVYHSPSVEWDPVCLLSQKAKYHCTINTASILLH